MYSTKIIASILIVSAMFFVSCKDMLRPDNDNHLTPDMLTLDPQYGEGFLLNGYTKWRNTYALDEVATDDAVTNDKNSSLLRMATGEWSALYTPMTVWNNSYNSLYYLNYFLSIVNKIDYSWDDRTSSSAERDTLFVKRFTGEAKILRAWHNFELLKNHGGIATNGNPQGYIIMNTGITDQTNNKLPRNSYDECVKFILDDINAGIALLPNTYGDITGNVPYNAVFGNTGNKNNNRVNGRFAKALKSRVMLFIASQSIYTQPAKWDSAAMASAKLLTVSGGGINGIAGLSATGVNFWKTSTDAEIIFRRDYANSNTREVDNYPPSLFGNGLTNPSQNLVDAFPMANGYPISHNLSLYNPLNPYNGRDPRLKAYIIYKGNDLNARVVNTNVEDLKDGLNQSITSTRTGYYLKKLLQPAVNINPNTMSTARMFYTLFRYTEIFLNYAEAANEAWGPDADPKVYGFTPRKIIAAIRKRGGITAADPYLATIITQADMRLLIRNERRIELCFEGFRFWDMRRWDINLNETIKGMSIAGTSYSVVDVEQRLYQPYMKFGPIPYQETLKDDRILQNNGW